MGEDFNRKAAELYAEQARTSTSSSPTALIPGAARAALLTEEMVGAMKPGSVVVDPRSRQWRKRRGHGRRPGRHDRERA
jgi:NAD/NADP transhydrogenase alpha subunit